MTNVISPYFTDEELETQLMMQFDEEEMYTIDFKSFFNQIEDVGDCLSLKIRDRTFLIDKITATVTEEG